jgi:hypothetical protein
VALFWGYVFKVPTYLSFFFDFLSAPSRTTTKSFLKKSISKTKIEKKMRKAFYTKNPMSGGILSRIWTCLCMVSPRTPYSCQLFENVIAGGPGFIFSSKKWHKKSTNKNASALTMH